MVATDFLRFLQQRTGWMGSDGCLVPEDYCHEWHLERSYFSVALQKAHEYLVRMGLPQDQPVSGEIESAIMDSWPKEFETLRKLAKVHGKALSKEDFKTELNQMIQLFKNRAPVVYRLLPRNEAAIERKKINLGLVLDEEMSSLWGSRRQYAFGKTLARLLFHHQITIMELNPIFAMLLFPLGGGKGHELSAHFYTDDLHNPAVIKGVMRDAFEYISKYHGVKTTYSDPNIHVEPDLQMLIGDGNQSSKKVHWSWETFNRLLKERQDQPEEVEGGEARLEEAITNPGKEFLTLLVHEQQPWYCHDFHPDISAKRSKFSLVLERADQFLFDQGLHPVYGIVRDGKVVNTNPSDFVDGMCKGGMLPKPLYDLLPYTIEDGEELCSDEFKLHLSEYVKVVKARAPVVKRKAYEQAQKLVKKYRRNPNTPRTAAEMLEQCKQRQHWTCELADGLLLTGPNVNLWGSRRQYGYGQTVARLLYFYKATSVELTPVFAMMMNPTGSIVGPANTSIFVGDVHDAIVCHAIVHDAFGYLQTFHKLGPGYNYLNVCDFNKTTSPLCCQFQGWAKAGKILKRWHMMGARGRQRRELFLQLDKKIPQLQSHEELELTHAFSRRLVHTNSIIDLDVDDDAPSSPTPVLSGEGTTPTMGMSSAAKFSM